MLISPQMSINTEILLEKIFPLSAGNSPVYREPVIHLSLSKKEVNFFTFGAKAESAQSLGIAQSC